MNENVRKLLNEQLWYIATCGNGPNVVPVGFHTILEDGTLAVGDVFMETTRANVLANGRAAVCVCNAATAESYQIKGSACYVTEGPVVGIFQAMAEAAFHGAVNAKGAVLITPQETIVATPGPNNKKKL